MPKKGTSAKPGAKSTTTDPKKAAVAALLSPPAGKPSALADACVDLIYIDPPFNSNRNYEVLWREMRARQSPKHTHAPGQALRNEAS
jgi:hypothetical protein